MRNEGEVEKQSNLKRMKNKKNKKRFLLEHST